MNEKKAIRSTARTEISNIRDLLRGDKKRRGAYLLRASFLFRYKSIAANRLRERNMLPTKHAA